ncbi:hypothetical protein chiPu_0002147 [Chiloscyllium punctatum]|uniref:Uncharacterized protein n=1 Tax=Chiloscyllium punctatum TaxID=137246 RepID=A0A401S041_CHIPU|nr:hypothetical protein [Chiloscyllium punctatum]
MLQADGRLRSSSNGYGRALSARTCRRRWRALTSGPESERRERPGPGFQSGRRGEGRGDGPPATAAREGRTRSHSDPVPRLCLLQPQVLL